MIFLYESWSRSLFKQILAFIVRVTGPEFLNEDSREAFARIEESVRQYSAHTRESIYLVRRPGRMGSEGYDHFVVLWSRGAAIVGLFPFGGDIYGGRRGKWTAESAVGGATSQSTFDNPCELLTAVRREIMSAIRQPEIVALAQALQPSQETAPLEGANLSPASPSLDLHMIALFTLPVRELRVEESLSDATFITMPVEHAVSRTMFHMPNLLRAIDRQSMVYSEADLQAFADLLGRPVTFDEMTGSTLEGAGPSEMLEDISAERPRRATSRKRLDEGAQRKGGWLPLKRSRLLLKGSRARTVRYAWGIPLVIIAAILLYYLLRSQVRPAVQKNPNTNVPPQPKAVPQSELTIELPSEVQLFISPSVYRTRSELDQALTHSEGQRYLPGTEQVIVLDSTVFAKGVYGYFKVENTWRKGKLLQTFHSNDTIQVDNFLPPLP